MTTSNTPAGSPLDITRKKSPWVTILISIIAVALIGGGLWYWRVSKQSGAGGWAGGGPIDVVATMVEPRSSPVTLEALGELRAAQQVLLALEAPGRVQKIAFESGQQVKQGNLLVQLDDGPEQADLAAAKAAAAFARQQLNRAKELAATGAQSREILQQRQADDDQAKALIRQLEARIRQKRIIAPFDGELGLRLIDPGQYLNPGEPAASLTNLDRLYADFHVTQQELNRVKVGQSVTVHVDTAGTTPVPATITAVEPQVNRATRNATIRAELDNTERRFNPGMYATVAVALPEEANSLVLPVSAIISTPYGDAVAVVKELSAEGIGSAAILPVVVGRRVGDQLIIAQGLKGGETVITEGQLRVQPGAQVRVIGAGAAEQTAEGS